MPAPTGTSGLFAHLFRLAAGSVALSLVLVFATPSAPPVARATTGACTGWTNAYLPPATIRVLRSVGPAAGHVQVVPFRQYVTAVLAGEFGPAAPLEALRAGAVAVKDFGWYFAMHWRGGSASGGCYDVVDSTWDQVYWPERYRAGDRQIRAVVDTWPVSVRKNGEFIATGYRTGSPGKSCGADADGWRLYQASAYRCAAAGMLYRAILRTYYGPNMQLIVPGLHDPTGDGLGEIGIVMIQPPLAAGTPGGASATPAPSAASMQAAAVDGSASIQSGPFWMIVGSDASGLPAPAATAAAGTAPVESIGWAFADLNHDGRADLVHLVRTGPADYVVSVALSEGHAFGSAATWWSSPGSGVVIPPGAVVRLLTGDFDGDGVEDAAILVGGAGTPPVVAPDGTIVPATAPEARLWVLRSLGTGFAAPTLAWSGALDLARGQAFAGDATGDGRAELIVTQPLYPADLPALADAGAAPPALDPDGTEVAIGTRVLVAESTPGGHLKPATTWADAMGVRPDAEQAVVTDVDGDGRADVVLFVPSGEDGSAFIGLMSNGRSFRQTTLWASSSGFRWSAAHIAASDVDGDGLGDVVALYDAGDAGTRLYEFLSDGTSFRAGQRALLPGLAWADALPF